MPLVSGKMADILSTRQGITFGVFRRVFQRRYSKENQRHRLYKLCTSLAYNKISDGEMTRGKMENSCWTFLWYRVEDIKVKLYKKKKFLCSYNINIDTFNINTIILITTLMLVIISKGTVIFAMKQYIKSSLMHITIY